MAWKVLEIVAVLFTLVNVWLAVKENMWTWPNGIVVYTVTGDSIDDGDTLILEER